MDTRHPQPDRRSIEAEASAWIVQLDGTRATEEDLAALREWMDRSPAHRHEMKRLSLLWDDMNVLTTLADEFAEAPARAPPHRTRAAALREFFGSLRGAVAATAVCGLLGLGTFAIWETLGPASVRVAQRTYSTAVGARETAVLEDGSRITLNTNTRVEVEFNPHSRRIRLLQGQALFEVAKNPHRPFLVYAGDGVVRAVGTAFSVYLQDRDHVQVIVTEGVVDLASTAESGIPRVGAADPPAALLARLKASQSANFGRSVDSLQTLAASEVDRQMAWRGGMLHFNGQPLSEVIREISRYTRQRIELRDPAIGEVRVGGYFKAGETEGMCEALEKGFGLHVERAGPDLIFLSRASGT